MTLRKITDEEWAALKTQYPAPGYELIRVELRMGDIVLRNPTETEYSAFASMRLDEAMRKNAFPNLLTMCAVFPAPDALQAAVRRYPGISSNPKIVRALQYIAGEADDLQGKG